MGLLYVAALQSRYVLTEVIALVIGGAITVSMFIFGRPVVGMFLAKDVQNAAEALDVAYRYVLVMSATPIPRTLAIILYGDLDISVLDQVPARRLPVKNCVVDPGWRPKAYDFIRKQVDLGHQAYVICPMVE